LFSDVEYSEVTSNMVRPNTMPDTSKGKQLPIDSKKSNAERSPGLKDILVGPEEIY